MGQNILKTFKKMGTVSCMYNMYKNTPVSINHESKANRKDTTNDTYTIFITSPLIIISSNSRPMSEFY